MAERFDKFTERAKKVLMLAQEEAQRFNHNYIGTEHLLLGLVREGEGVAAKVLGNLGVELQSAQRRRVHHWSRRSHRCRRYWSNSARQKGHRVVCRRSPSTQPPLHWH